MSRRRPLSQGSPFGTAMVILPIVNRDLRDSALYKEIEEHFRRALEPGFGRITGGSDLAPSPDGRRIAFTGSLMERLEGTPSTRIAVADVETGAIEQITAGPNDDRLPRWSPDGSRLAFLSDRGESGRFQAFVLSSDRIGEAVALPEVEGTLESLAWSPDGSRLLLCSAGLGADRPAASGSGVTRAANELPAWLPQLEGGGEHEWRRLWVLDLEAREVRRLSQDGTNVWEAGWSGDGAIAAIASAAPDESAWHEASLVLIDADTGAERGLLRSAVQLGLPTPNDGGTRIAVVEALCSDRLVVAGDLLLVDPSTGEVTLVDTHGVDVSDVAWRTAERCVYLGLRALETVAGEVDASTGAVTERWSTSTESCGTWYPAGRPLGDEALAVVLDGHDRPPDLSVIQDGKAETVHAFDHEGTRYVAEGSGVIDEVAWTAPDGTELQGLLVVPDGSGPHALVVMIHGGPTWAYTNRWPRPLAQVLVARGFALFLPNPRGSSGRGRAFAEMVVGDMGGADAGDILAGIDAMVERGVADPERVGISGGSYGGFMACWLPTIDARFSAAVAVSPVSDWYSQHFGSNLGRWDVEFLQSEPTTPGGPYRDRSPVMFADRVRTPTLLTAGLTDKVTPPGQAIEFYRALREHGIETEVALYPEEGHGVRAFPATIDACTRTVAWFERFMPPNRM